MKRTLENTKQKKKKNYSKDIKRNGNNTTKVIEYGEKNF